MNRIVPKFQRLIQAVVAGIALMLCCRLSRGGWVEDRPDGSTIIHVVVYQLPDPTATDAQTRAEVASVNMFKKRFPEIFQKNYRAKYEADPKRYGKHHWDHVEIELQQFAGLQVEGAEPDLLAIATGTPPDVMMVNFHRSDHFIQSGFLYPLDNPADGYLTDMPQEEIDRRIHPKILPVIKRPGPGGETHIWAMPSGGLLGTVLLYRKDLFDKHGLAYPDANWTWDDMLTACRKITDPANGIYGLIGGGGRSESWFWFTYLWSAGGQVMSEDPKTGQWRCDFDSRAAAVSLDFYEKLNNEKWIDATGKMRYGYTIRDFYGVDSWRRGEVGMYVTYIDQDLFQNLNPDLTGMAPLPLGPGNNRGGELNSRMLGLSSQTTDIAVRDAAWQYIRYFDCDESEQIKTRIMVEGGVGPFLNPELLRRYGYSEIERLAPKGWSDIFKIAIDSGQPEPYGPNASYIYKIASYPVQEVEAMLLHGQLPEEREARLDAIQAVLHKGVERANEEMFGLVAPAERQKRDRTALAVILVFVPLFLLLMWRLMRVSAPAQVLAVGAKKRSFRRHLPVILLLLPAVGTILMWQYVPLGRGSAMAFQDYRLMGNSQWVGLRNFGDLLYDPTWWQSVWNALRYSALIMALTFVPPIILAILLQEVPRGSVVFRVVYYLPAVLSGLVTMLLWKRFFQPSENGLLNVLIMHIPAIGYLGLGIVLLVLALSFSLRLVQHGKIGAALLVLIVGIILLLTCADWALPILWPNGETLRQVARALPHRMFKSYSEPYRWLTDPETAMLACVIPLVWASVGPGCLIYLAALKGIPDDYYEAADLDGATFIDKVMFVVFPILRPLILINFIGVFIGSWFGSESNILAMTGGSAGTEVAGLHIFFKAFTNLQFGMATAMAWVLASMLIGLTAYQLRIIGRLEFKTTGGKK